MNSEPRRGRAHVMDVKPGDFVYDWIRKRWCLVLANVLPPDSHPSGLEREFLFLHSSGLYTERFMGYLTVENLSPT